jgi:hypothetical protein
MLLEQQFKNGRVTFVQYSSDDSMWFDFLKVVIDIWTHSNQWKILGEVCKDDTVQKFQV